MSSQSHLHMPHTYCHICAHLADSEVAYQKHGRPEENSYLPTAAHSLILIKDFHSHTSRTLQLQQCPVCHTYYRYRTDYEFLVNGSEDEEELTRLTAAEAQAYLDRPIAE